MSSPSNRTTPHDGRTARQDKGKINILVDAELKDISMCFKIYLSLLCCSGFNKERSYLYLRENSLESNVVFDCCCGCQLLPDMVKVEYFDRPPYNKSCKPGPFPCCFLCHSSEPSFEFVEPGCMLCCMKVNPLCQDEKLVLMPFEKFPVPFCCCSNRTTACDNCFGFCGPITGSPKIYTTYFLQPTDPRGFVEATRVAMDGPALSQKEMRGNPVNEKTRN